MPLSPGRDKVPTALTFRSPPPKWGPATFGTLVFVDHGPVDDYQDVLAHLKTVGLIDNPIKVSNHVEIQDNLKRYKPTGVIITFTRASVYETDGFVLRSEGGHTTNIADWQLAQVFQKQGVEVLVAAAPNTACFAGMFAWRDVVPAVLGFECPLSLLKEEESGRMAALISGALHAFLASLAIGVTTARAREDSAAAAREHFKGALCPKAHACLVMRHNPASDVAMKRGGHIHPSRWFLGRPTSLGCVFELYSPPV